MSDARLKALAASMPFAKQIGLQAILGMTSAPPGL